MKSEEKHEGGCACGAVRYRTLGQPDRHAVCHCRYCQLRTGAPFGMGAYFRREKMTILSGKCNVYEYTTVSGSEVKTYFCVNCGTTTHWKISSEMFEGLLAVAVGTYDPPTFWFKAEREVFLRSKADFVNNDIENKFDTSVTYKPIGEDSLRKTPIFKTGK